jgi:hypothetical protein
MRQVLADCDSRGLAIAKCNAGAETCKEHGYDFVAEIFHHFGGRLEVYAGTPKGLAHQKTLF